MFRVALCSAVIATGLTMSLSGCVSESLYRSGEGGDYYYSEPTVEVYDGGYGSPYYGPYYDGYRYGRPYGGIGYRHPGGWYGSLYYRFDHGFGRGFVDPYWFFGYDPGYPGHYYSDPYYPGRAYRGGHDRPRQHREPWPPGQGAHRRPPGPGNEPGLDPDDIDREMPGRRRHLQPRPQPPAQAGIPIPMEGSHPRLPRPMIADSGDRPRFMAPQPDAGFGAEPQPQRHQAPPAEPRQREYEPPPPPPVMSPPPPPPVMSPPPPPPRQAEPRFEAPERESRQEPN